MKIVKRFFLMFLFLAGIEVLFEGHLLAAGGDLLWEQQLGVGFHSWPIQVLIDGQQLIAIGAAVVEADFLTTRLYTRTELFVAAYDLSTTTPTGGVVWSDTVGGWDGGDFSVSIAGLVVSGQDIFVLRYSESSGNVFANRTFLRKYDRVHGTRLWEQEVFGPSGDKWVSPSSLTVTGGKVFVSGATGPYDRYRRYLNPQAFTRAYNGANGHVIWSAKSPIGSGAGASTSSGNQVFVVLGQGSRQLLRAYNATTGAKLWERVIDPKKSVGPMKVNGNQLFLAGSTNTGGNYGADYVVQSDRIDTGTLLWENTLKNPGNDGASDLVVAGQKVFIGGTQTNAAGSQDFMVKALDALTGRLLWKSLADTGGPDSVSGVVASSGLGMVFAVGSAGVCPPYYNSGYGLVRAYNMNTGALAWESAVDDGGGDCSYERIQYASQAVVAGERLFVVGGYNNINDGDDYYSGPVLIRAYAAK